MLKKYIKPFLKNNKCFILAYDRGISKSTDDFKYQSQNPLFIYNLAKTIKATGIILNKGLAEIFYENHWMQVPLVIKLDYKNKAQQTIVQTCSVAYAKKLGAKAVGYTIYFGSKFESEQIKNFSSIVEQAHQEKMGVILWAYTVEDDFSTCQDVAKIKNSLRASLELGADLIKLSKIGSLDKIAEIKSVVPNLLIALRGGDLTSEADFVEYIKKGIKNEIDGFIIGRNIWQQEKATEIGQKIHQTIFNS